MASNTPLRRYKQNTHGGGIRDPFVMSWPKRIKAKGELRHQFVHACDLVPTLLELIGIEAPARSRAPRKCRSKARALPLRSPTHPRRRRSSPQYFEMFGHRGLWHRRLEGGRRSIPPVTPFENDKWELFHLDRDFSEVDDLAAKEPQRLAR